MLRGDGVAFEKHDYACIVDPRAQYCLKREAPPAKVFLKILLFDRMRTLERDFPGFVAYVQLGNVAFFREFDALFVGKFREAPEHATAAGRAARMETIASALYLAVANR